MKRLCVVCIAFLSLTLWSCRRAEEEAPPMATTEEVPGTTSPSDVSPVTAQAWIDDVTIGHEVGADGMVPAGRTGDDFAPGAPVFVAMNVKDAPAGSAVKVMWYGPGEKVVGEEQKDIVAGSQFLNFRADTKGWARGDYRAEIWVGDEKVNTQQFQIVPPSKAGK